MADTPITTSPDAAGAPAASSPAVAGSQAPVAPAAPIAQPAAPAEPVAPIAAEPAPSSPQPAAPSADAPPADGPIEPVKAEPAKQEFPPTAMEAGKKPEEPKPEVKAEEKPVEAVEAEKPAEQPTPTYEFTWPEDIKADAVDQESMGKFTAALAKTNAPQEVAQEMLDLHLAESRKGIAAAVDRYAAQQWDHFRQTTNGWHDEIKANEEVGGARYDTAMRTVATVIEQYLPAERQKQLYDRLRATGMGNDLNLTLLFHRLGSMLGREATPVIAPEPRRAPLTRQQRGEARYAGTTR